MVQPGRIGAPDQRRPLGPAAPGDVGLERDHGPLRQQDRPAPPGSRVFIWTRQVINGRKEALQRAHAEVPPPEM